MGHKGKRFCIGTLNPHKLLYWTFVPKKLEKSEIFIISDGFQLVFNKNQVQL